MYPKIHSYTFQEEETKLTLSNMMEMVNNKVPRDFISFLSQLRAGHRFRLEGSAMTEIPHLYCTQMCEV